MPSSSISISPTPDSCTIFTSSRIRSPRSASASSAMSTESREWRARMTLSSSSASEPNIAMRTSSSSLAARPSACSRTSSVVTGSSASCAGRREQLDRALDRRVDRLRRHAVAALDELAELVDDGAVAPRLEHVQERLRGEDLADRRRERRPARLGADAPDLLEHLEQPVGGGVRAEMDVERRDEAGREVVLGRAHGDARRDGRDRLVADVLVDDVGGLPELVDVEPRRVARAPGATRRPTRPRRGGA